MNMKKLTLLLIASLYASSSAGQADPIYYPENGLLVLSDLRIGSQTYYVELKQLPDSLDFRVDQSTIRQLATTEGNGSPSAPKMTSFGVRNTLLSDDFFNYFSVNAAAGQKLIVSTKLDQPLTDTQKSRCTSTGTIGTNIRAPYDTQIHVYNSKLTRIGGVCGEDLTFQFTVSGIYILHFNYASQSSGYFNATIL
jgi:hypothetical protein